MAKVLRVNGSGGRSVRGGVTGSKVGGLRMMD